MVVILGEKVFTEIITWRRDNGFHFSPKGKNVPRGDNCHSGVKKVIIFCRYAMFIIYIQNFYLKLFLCVTISGSLTIGEIRQFHIGWIHNFDRSYISIEIPRTLTVSIKNWYSVVVEVRLESTSRYLDLDKGYIDVGDGCWRRNVLVTNIRCWWQLWSFSSPTSLYPLTTDFYERFEVLMTYF